MSEEPKVTGERVVLVGAGGYGRRHLDYLLSGRGKEHFILRAVVEPNPERCPESIATLREFEIPHFPTAEAFLETGNRVDLAVLSVPIPCHEPLSRAFLRERIDVLMEKPPVAVPSQLLRLRKEASDKNRVCQIAFHWPPSPFFVHLKERLLGGQIGRIRAVHGYGLFPRRRGYYQRSAWAGKLSLNGQPVFDSPANNALAHLVHILSWLAGPDLKRPRSPVQIGAELYRSKPIESYDTCLIRGRLEDEIRFAFGATHSCPDPVSTGVPAIQLTVEGTKGDLRAESGPGGFTLHDPADPGAILAKGEPTIDHPYEDRLAHLRGARDRPLVTLEEAGAFTWIVAAAHASSRIADVDRSFLRQEGDRSDPLVVIPGCAEILPQATRMGVSLQEAGARWAVEPGEPIFAEPEVLAAQEGEVLGRLSPTLR